MKAIVKTKEQYRQALLLYSSLAELPIHNGDEVVTVDEYIEEFPIEDVKIVGINNHNRISTWSYVSNDTNEKDFSIQSERAKILEYLLSIKSTIIVKNVGIYDAVISKNGIRVGCQNITFEKFQEIVDAVKKVNKN